MEIRKLRDKFNMEGKKCAVSPAKVGALRANEIKQPRVLKKHPFGISHLISILINNVSLVGSQAWRFRRHLVKVFCKNESAGLRPEHKMPYSMPVYGVPGIRVKTGFHK